MALYFFAADTVGLVKIGHSAMVESRLRTCLGWSPVPLRIAATDVAGGHLTEAELHHRFRQWRRHSEWFEMAPPVVAVMEETARTGAVPDGWYSPAGYPLRNSSTVVGASLHALRHRLGVTVAEVAEVIPFSTYANWGQGELGYGIPAAVLPKMLEHLRKTRPGLTYHDLLAVHGAPSIVVAA